MPAICQALEKMNKPIQDEFTALPLSHQRKYQLRKKRDKRCTICGAPAAQGARCVKHLVQAREDQRARFSRRRRYATLSYRLEDASSGPQMKVKR
jgi:hypothetical protein